MQETRTPEAFSCHDDVLRLGTGSQSGCYGVELWVNLRVPYCYVGRTAHYFESCHFQVLHRDPRKLLVSVVTPLTCLKVLVGHAPHTGCDESQRQLWWEEFSALASHCGEHERLIILADANADPGPADGCTVLQGQHRTSANTPLLQAFLHAHCLCLPATGALHEGSTTTWTSPNGLHHHCLDHVIIPQRHLEDCTHSSVLHDFDLGNGLWDHTAVALQMRWTSSTVWSPPSSSAAVHGRYDPQQVQQTHLRHVLGNYAVDSWETDIETQIGHFNRTILQGVAQLCPKRSRGPKKSFISDEVWHLRTCKLDHRRSLKYLNIQERRALLALCS